MSDLTDTFKRGADFLRDGAAFDNTTGVEADFTLWQIASQIRDGETLIADLALTWVDRAKGKFRLSCAAAETASWPLKRLKWDIKYTTGTGQVIYSQTMTLVIIDRETA